MITAPADEELIYCLSRGVTDEMDVVLAVMSHMADKDSIQGRYLYEGSFQHTAYLILRALAEHRSISGEIMRFKERQAKQWVEERLLRELIMEDGEKFEIGER